MSAAGLPTDCGKARRDAELRAFASEMLEGVARNASIAVQFLEMGDDHGAEYAARRGAAYFRAAVGTLALLKNSKRKEVANAAA